MWMHTAVGDADAGPGMEAGRRSPGVPLGACWSIGVVVATGLAAWLIAAHLGQEPFGRDEVASVGDARRSLGGTLEVAWNYEGNAWLYYLLLHGWIRLGGTGEAWIRLPAALAAVATVPAVAVLVRGRLGVWASLVAAFVMAGNAQLATVGQFARGYGFVALLAALSVLALVRAVERPSRGRWLAWAALSGAMVNFHILAGLLVLAQLASLPALPHRRERLATAGPGAALLAALCLPIVLYAAFKDAGQISWITTPSIFDGARFAKVATSTWPLMATYAVLTLALVASTWRRRREDGAASDAVWWRCLVLLWVLLPPALLLVVSQVKPLFVPNYMTVVVPGLGALAATAVAALRAPALARVAALCLLVGTLAGVLRRPDPFPVDEDLRGAAAFIVDHQRPGDGIAYAPAFVRPGVDYYLQRELRGRRGPRDLDLAPGRSAVAVGGLFGEELPAAAVAANLRASPRVWLAEYPGSNWHPTPEPVLRVGPDVLGEDFVRRGTWVFGVSLTLFVRRPGARP